MPDIETIAAIACGWALNGLVGYALMRMFSKLPFSWRSLRRHVVLGPIAVALAIDRAINGAPPWRGVDRPEG